MQRRTIPDSIPGLAAEVVRERLEALLEFGQLRLLLLFVLLVAELEAALRDVLEAELAR